MKLSQGVVVAVCMGTAIAGAWAAENAATNAPKPQAVQAVAPTVEAAPGITFKNEQEKVSYAIGYQAGSRYRAQDVPVDIAMLIQGLKDGLGGQKPALPDDQATLVLQNFQKEMAEKENKKRQELAAINQASGKAFLEANAKKEGVKVLPSGLQYKVLKEGTGKIPVASDKVKVHYRGTLINGTEFDSSYKRGEPAEFPVTGVIKGWVEALQLMKEGSKWEVYIPANLAYGENGSRAIQPNSTLIFEVELLEILKPEAGAAVPVVPAPSAGTSAPKPGVPVTPKTGQATK